MNANKLATSKQHSKLKKLNGKYFLPFEIWDYLDFGWMFILIVFFSYASATINFIFISIIIIYLIRIITTINDRFFIEIKTSKPLNENINLINELAKRQQNFSQSMNEEGLFLFQYSERNVFYRYNYRKRDYIETVVIFCEDNSIWVNSYNQRYFGLFRRQNLKQWIKLLQIKSEN